MAKKPRTLMEQGLLNRLMAGATLTPDEEARLGDLVPDPLAVTAALQAKNIAARRAFLEASGYPTTGLPKQEPLAPRGKPESGGGIRIPLRSQTAFAKGTTRRKGDK